MYHPLAPEHEGQWSIINRKVIRELVPVVGTQAMGIYALFSAMAGSTFTCVIDKPILALETGLKQRPLQTILDSLVTNRVITLKETSSSYTIVLNWKPLPIHKETVQQKFIRSTYYTNDITKKIYKKSNESNRFTYELTKQLNAIKKYMNTPEQIQIATEIANALDDRKAMPLHLMYARQVPHKKLRELLEYVVSIPERKIYKSRAAYFTSLVEKYKLEQNDDYNEEEYGENEKNYS